MAEPVAPKVRTKKSTTSTKKEKKERKTREEETEETVPNEFPTPAEDLEPLSIDEVSTLVSDLSFEEPRRPAAPKVPDWAKDAHGRDLSPETVELLRAAAQQASETNRRYRSLGWGIAHDGSLFEPATVVVGQTGTAATIQLAGDRFYLDVGETRRHNELIKGLGGHWKGYKHAWEFEGFDALPKVRQCFAISSESGVSGGSGSSSSHAAASHSSSGGQVAERRHYARGVVHLSVLGTSIFIRGDTRPIKEYLKAVVLPDVLRWDSREGWWQAHSRHQEAIEAKLDELKESGLVTSYEHVDPDE